MSQFFQGQSQGNINFELDQHFQLMSDHCREPTQKQSAPTAGNNNILQYLKDSQSKANPAY
jgi:hypothetical protein